MATITVAPHGSVTINGTKPFARVKDSEHGAWRVKDSTGAYCDVVIDGPALTGSPQAPSVFADSTDSVAELDAIITAFNA
jgi:hypothetical protein